MTSEDVLEALVEECREDHVGLWRVLNAVRFDLGPKGPTEAQAMTLQLVRSLLRERGMQVGHPAPDGRHFVSWGLSPEQAVSRIEREWRALGREPNIGEVAWFTSEQEAPNWSLEERRPESPSQP
jgi:hypothetical protein